MKVIICKIFGHKMFDITSWELNEDETGVIERYRMECSRCGLEIYKPKTNLYKVSDNKK